MCQTNGGEGNRPQPRDAIVGADLRVGPLPGSGAHTQVRPYEERRATTLGCPPNRHEATPTAPTALYIHIPFCRAKCAYCDFASYQGLERLLDPYVAALCREIASLPHLPGPPLRTLYLGGGTPSLLSLSQVEHILSTVRRARTVVPEAEVTMEANPGTVDLTYLRGLTSLGINRLSLGVQSLDDAELGQLGRIHTAEEARQAVGAARRAGFANLSLDLIYGLPGQALSRWEDTLAAALTLQPDHLSLYALTVEEHTPLARSIATGAVPAPDDDAAAEMYELAEDALAAAGFDHYEISNWSRDPEHRCRHNLVYWHNQPYWGVGAAAHSWWNGRRYSNHAHPVTYIRALEASESPVAGEECLDRATEIGETAMLALRLAEGLSGEGFRRRFRRRAEGLFGPAIRECREAGLLEGSGDSLRLTRRGRLLGNEVFQRFLRDAEATREAEATTEPE